MDKELVQLANEFRSRFGSAPRFFQAPGRVNLIGEHTDYNLGFVMPFAIDRRTVVAGAPRGDTKLNIWARDIDESATIDLADKPTIRRGNWIDYVEGSVRCVAERTDSKLRGADLMISSTVPIGAGLSSSAAIEIATGFAILSLNDVPIDEEQLAFAGQEAEHKFVGIRSGIMDQFAAVFGRRGSAMLLDCRSLEIAFVPITNENISFAVIDTKVKHNLASSEYNTRRSECESAVEILQQDNPHVNSLRDVTLAILEKYGNKLPDVIRRRCRHVVSENLRTLAAADAFRRSDLAKAGELMFASHRSLRDDYEVSCPELDLLVDSAGSIDGVYGARMTGGGFGGCTVNLVKTEAVQRLNEITAMTYESKFGFAPDFYLFQPADGASEISAGDLTRSPIDVAGSRM
jgi:galactokinase